MFWSFVSFYWFRCFVMCHPIPIQYYCPGPIISNQIATKKKNHKNNNIMSDIFRISTSLFIISCYFAACFLALQNIFTCIWFLCHCIFKRNSKEWREKKCCFCLHLFHLYFSLCTFDKISIIYHCYCYILGFSEPFNSYVCSCSFEGLKNFLFIYLWFWMNMKHMTIDIVLCYWAIVWNEYLLFNGFMWYEMWNSWFCGWIHSHSPLDELFYFNRMHFHFI